MSNVRATRPYRKRRQYTPEFKAQLVAESQIPGASVARIALDNDLNANLLGAGLLSQSSQINSYHQRSCRLICQRQLLQQ